jgi:hypothetical protein
MSRTHEQNLDCIRQNLSRAAARATANPSDWNISRANALHSAETDYLRLMAGDIQRQDMCQTAKDLTTEMPAWGTYGT